MKINPFSKRRSLAVIAILALLLGMLPGSAFAAPMPDRLIVPVTGSALNVNVAVVNDGSEAQTDPHISGKWISYTDRWVDRIRFRI